MTVKEIVDQINAAKLCTRPTLEDTNIDMTDCVHVDTVDRDEHRWYVNATNVYKMGDEFFGIHGAIQLLSEDMGFNDCAVVCEAFEMESVPSKTYRRK